MRGTPYLSAVTAAALLLFLRPCEAKAKIALAPPVCSNVTESQTWDYIIVGSGAAGIPLADHLSEAGHTVLLLEKGPPSTGIWGGTMKPQWLQNSTLTRFDVPGLANEIWHNPTGIVCTDVDQMAGCVLGGGVAVNSGLWWKPHPEDWDRSWPAGWHSADLAAATERVFKRIPGTTTPSADGQLYLQQGFDVLTSGLSASGWDYLVPNDHPDRKNRTYGHSTHMFSSGERGGPLATYLVSASKRESFTLWMNTTARRVVRDGGHAVGVEIECTRNAAGHAGIVSVTPGTGRVILSAGAFGSAKLLFRSGIGPVDQLKVVQNSTLDAATMISEDSWINLPVGHNLIDHVGTDIEVSHPEVVFYDFYGAWSKPILSDTEKYLENRTGILAQAAPNLGPIFWEIIPGTDGVDRHLHWQARVEGTTNISMTITQYLGTGSTSRGRMVITPQLNTRVSVPPYLRDAADRAAVIEGLERVRQYFSPIANLRWVRPAANQTSTQFVDSIPATPALRCSNHWVGTAKMGASAADGTAVVDTDARVFSTDNLFVVDASIFPGMMTGNPSAMIVAAAEHAADRILALPAPEKAAAAPAVKGVRAS
ncbi:putative cellobiose dehydrogenase [Durotheca rogersii]|uniref:putative cellobiose dehydrogenase n=1 Tax=Durotheca rogersii TaxID=419775 RepID=UPI00221F7E89|nr:putative cellobiose dehydrogenase [Durotheca rogersii]KAI5868206.1 putative cellobiose dehydrogenase [Durotheca rogersii]